MLGAIAGDIIGSVKENLRTKRKDFRLFTPLSIYTDDTVLTTAVADALLTGKDYGSTIRAYARRHPLRGYGPKFLLWMFSPSNRPYNTWAMAPRCESAQWHTHSRTATRREESLQDVALTVSAVTGEEINKLKMFKFEDVATVTPGLSMGSTTGGASGGAISLRGVGFNTNASTAPAVDVYYNELPLDASYASNSMFDVQQVEVLRGPQGTLRGRPAPAGAITLTTRRPDLDEFGGTV